jgi:hypothetical protein
VSLRQSDVIDTVPVEDERFRRQIDALDHGIEHGAASWPADSRQITRDLPVGRQVSGSVLRNEEFVQVGVESVCGIQTHEFAVARVDQHDDTVLPNAVVGDLSFPPGEDGLTLIPLNP